MWDAVWIRTASYSLASTCRNKTTGPKAPGFNLPTLGGRARPLKGRACQTALAPSLLWVAGWRFGARLGWEGPVWSKLLQEANADSTYLTEVKETPTEMYLCPIPHSCHTIV